MNQRQGAQQLVERARAGDQNAVAMIAMVGQNARQGNPRAKSAYALILEFIQKNSPKSIMGAETAEALGVLKEPSNPLESVFNVLCNLPILGDPLAIQAACVILGNGPAWSKPKVKSIDASLAGAEQNLFRYGFDNAASQKQLQPIAQQLPKEAIGFLCAGHCIGSARKIQLARLPQVPVSVLSADVGWELGC
jgi:hypothetical protein